MVDANQMAGYMRRLVQESGKPMILELSLTVGDNRLKSGVELLPEDAEAPGLMDKKIDTWLSGVGYTCMALADKQLTETPAPQ